MILKDLTMTLDNTNLDYDKIKATAIKNSNAIDAALKNDVPTLKEKSISKELNSFWNAFESKVNGVLKNKKDNEVINVYSVLSENRAIVISEFDILEPWFVKIEGVNSETGEIDREIINSRTNDHEIIVEAIEITE
ncbi:hypothetical protein [Methanobrevibacter filiformis]|uniref:Uncharacterized protein n=1 Tax=Methanobrevibacter filiformis TaxID=55758 RepID=A0A166DFY7_9EURY|nr:hypothetical protein [Methanobrevibacter filiformis]KZX15564.1 hypothetical protein MBFIL_06300 [Methanobrevibacter filiformis]